MAEHYDSGPSFTRFDIPISRDRYGGVTMKACVVSDNMLPVMADIIEKATRSVLLRQEYTLLTSQYDARLSSDVVDQLRERIRYDLEHGLREEAKKGGLAVITEIAFSEQGDGLGVQFVATATAMPLLEKGLGA